MSTCATCGNILDRASVLCGATTCTTCELRTVSLAADPWAFFLRTLRANVRSDGSLHTNDVRELLRGRIEPKEIGLLYRRAKSAGLLAGGNEWEPSTDERGGNGEKQARVWRWVERKAVA